MKRLVLLSIASGAFLFAAIASIANAAPPQGSNIIQRAGVTSYNINNYGIGFSTGPLTLFADPLGNDANACTATGTSACRQPQAAINKIPKFLRAQATVTAACGDYQGFAVSGFTTDYNYPDAGAGILVSGTMADSTTLASGSATGTATSGTAGSINLPFGTLVDAAATWTVNDLNGRYITLNSGTGILATPRVISSNTATTITIEGTWTAPTGTTTYSIQEPCSRIIQGTLTPSSTTLTTSTRVPIVVTNNNTALGFVTVRRWWLAPTTSQTGVRVIYNPSAVALSQLWYPDAGTAAVQITTAGSVLIDNLSSTLGPGSTSVHITASAGTSGYSVLSVSQSLLRYGNTGISSALPVTLSSMETVDQKLVAVDLFPSISLGSPSPNGTAAFAGGVMLDCVPDAGIAVRTGSPFNNSNVGGAGGNITTDRLQSNDCLTMFALGPAATLATGFGGRGATCVQSCIKVNARGGALAELGAHGNGLSTEELLINGVSVGTTLELAGTGQCISDLVNGTSICSGVP